MAMPFGEALGQQLQALAIPKDKLHRVWQDLYPFVVAGCSTAEIEQLRELQETARLPEIFVEFLKCAGKRCGDIFIGYDIGWQYMGAYNMKRGLNKILALAKHEAVKDSDFVFMNLQGHSYWFFSTEMDDPPVYMYILDDGSDDDEYPCRAGAVQVSDYVSEFLTRFISKRESQAAQDIFLQTYAAPYRL